MGQLSSQPNQKVSFHGQKVCDRRTLGKAPMIYISNVTGAYDSNKVWCCSERFIAKLVCLYPLVNFHIAMERSTMFNGNIHYKWPFSIAMLVHQRVTSISRLGLRRWLHTYYGAQTNW